MPRAASSSTSTTTTTSSTRKRTKEPKTAEECANPLFASWLYDWLEEQRALAATSPSAQKLMYIYSKAYNGMLKFPLRLETGRECIQIQGIGEKIADRLEHKLTQYRRENGIPEPPSIKSTNTTSNQENQSENGQTKTKGKKRAAPKPKQYIPSYRTGAYAIILALHRHAGSTGYMSKHQIIEKAQPFCDSSFTVPSTSNRFYTSWSSMEGLIDKELVFRYGNPPRFGLTEEGKQLGARLESFHANKGLDGSEQVTKNSTSHGPPYLQDDDEEELELEDEPMPPARNRERNQMSARSYTEKPNTSIKAIPTNKIIDEYQSNLQVIEIMDDSDHEERPRPHEQISVIARNEGRQVLPSVSAQQKSHSHFLSSTVQKTTSASMTGQNFRHFSTLARGSFDIFLVMDSREVRKKTDRSFFQAQLESKGIRVLTRAMELGDILWIAKEKTDMRRKTNLSIFHVDGEVVLDFIIERKTLDDLASSITDGRFREQKFRLKSCGARNIMYLVEKTTGLDTSSLSTQTIQSAIVQTQILEGFMTKMTRGPDDTISFLALMTKQLIEIYRNQELRFIDSIFTTKEDFLNERLQMEEKDNMRYFLGFELFMSINCKTKCFTRGDIWIRQLMTIRGISAEKAAAIAKVYPTLQSLLDALSTRPTDEGRQELLRTVGEGRKAIGRALAQKMVEFFCHTEYDDSPCAFN